MAIGNYRTFHFKLSGIEYEVVGMANPKINFNLNDPLKQLHDDKVTHIIALQPDQHSLANVQDADLGINYISMPVLDFTAPTPAQFDEVFKLITAPAPAPKKIAIHCAAGMGRTGALLASLKLRELVDNKSNDSTQKKTSMVYLGRFGRYKYTLSTPLVYHAIKAIRDHNNENPEEKSIEVRAQVEALCDLQGRLQLDIENVLPQSNQEHIAIKVARAVLLAKNNLALEALLGQEINDDCTLNQLIFKIQTIVFAEHEFKLGVTVEPDVLECYAHIIAHPQQTGWCEWLYVSLHIFTVKTWHGNYDFLSPLIQYITSVCDALRQALFSPNEPKIDDALKL